VSAGWEQQIQSFLGQVERDRRTEQGRELVVRTLTCPVCEVQSPWRCTYGGYEGKYSHTGRYNLAAGRGLVPELGGVR